MARRSGSPEPADEQAARLAAVVPDAMVRWSVPGRVNLIGDHTDYCDGFVLPMAIDRRCLVALAPRTNERVRARSLEMDGTVDAATDGRDDPALVEPRWGRFVVGAVQAVVAQGIDIPGCEVAVSSTVPAGSGLSSSSALSVALVLALADVGGATFERRDIARIALDAEVRATGVPGGLMDQLTALFGEAEHALLIDCRSLDVAPIPLPEDIAVVVVHSGVERTLAATAYAERRADCERAAARLGVPALRDATIDQVRDDPRARHVVTENARVLAFADVLRAGDAGQLGALMLESHASLRDDFEVSTPELDRLVHLFVEHGAYGARLTGAGFGGCVVAIVATDVAAAVLEQVTSDYERDTGLAPTAFAVHASDGARSVASRP